jgi:hypothetical protein
VIYQSFGKAVGSNRIRLDATAGTFMDQTLDKPAARRLFARARRNLAEQVAADAVLVRAAAETGIRRSPHDAVLRLLPPPDALEVALARLQAGAHQIWLRAAAVIGGSSAIVVLGLAVSQDAVTALISAGVVAAMAAVGLAGLRRYALGRMRPEDIAAVRALIGEYLVVDADGIHEYRLSSDGASVDDRHWPTDSVTGLSYGWPGLPGLMIGTRHRKTRLGEYRMRDGGDARDLTLEEIDARFASIFGARYAGTTEEQKAAA